MFKGLATISSIFMVVLISLTRCDWIERGRDKDTFQGGSLCNKVCNCEPHIPTHVLGETFNDMKCINDYKIEFGK
jgi:hypothetical protein